MRGKTLARSTILGFAVAAYLVVPSTAQTAKEPSSANIGKKIPNLSFKNETGNVQALHDLKNQKAIVMVFFCFECPVSNSYVQPLADMHKEYGKHGVSFLGLTVNEDQTLADVAKQAKDFDVKFPVFLDEGLAAAKALKADVTPEVFVLDGNFILRYRGRIDNAYTERLKKHNQETKQDLRQVIGELLSGRPVSTTATVSIGCPIYRAARDAVKETDVTYHKDVSPILQNHCQTCHRPGEVGPFSLMDYRQAVNWADDIKSYTQKKLMPPWKPVAGAAFHNERRLSPKEIDTLAAWVDGGAPEGDPKDAPAARTFPAGWQLGDPDLILKVEEEFVLGPTGKDLFRCFVLPTHLTEDKYITAIEVRPSNPRVVHHVLLFTDTSGKGRELEKAAQEKKKPLEEDHPVEATYDRGSGYTVAMGIGFPPQGGLSGWAPGQMPRFLPEGSGFSLPKKSDVIMQVHFHRNGRVEKDRTQIGLYFAKKPVTKPYRGGTLVGGASGAEGVFRFGFVIPPGAEHFVLKGQTKATADFTLYSVMPHMHMLGKEIKVTMTPPDGPAQTLVAIKEWDYNWQETYMFKEPVHVKKGTQFDVEAIYDNSAKNPNNPFSPPRRVTFGEQTFNEMCFVFFGGSTAGSSRRLPLSPINQKKDEKKE